MLTERENLCLLFGPCFDIAWLVLMLRVSVAVVRGYRFSPRGIKKEKGKE